MRFCKTKSQIRSDLENKYREIWNNRWINSVKGRTIWDYITEVNYKRILLDFYINQVITGHGIFPKFQCDRFNKDDTCICMLKSGTIEHVLK